MSNPVNLPSSKKKVNANLLVHNVTAYCGIILLDNGYILIRRYTTK